MLSSIQVLGVLGLTSLSSIAIINQDPNIKALKRRGFINHGSTLTPEP